MRDTAKTLQLLARDILARRDLAPSQLRTALVGDLFEAAERLETTPCAVPAHDRRRDLLALSLLFGAAALKAYRFGCGDLAARLEKAADLVNGLLEVEPLRLAA